MIECRSTSISMLVEEIQNNITGNIWSMDGNGNTDILI